jgi:hypothetical protein
LCLTALISQAEGRRLTISAAGGSMPVKQLTQIDDGLWCLESHFVVWGCKGSLRMSLIQSHKGIVIYSPVRLEVADIEQIRRMGHVSAIIAPNLYHHTFLRPYMEAFPEARILVPNGLQAKIGDIRGAQVMTQDCDLGLSRDLDHHIFAGHKLRETILFHRPTATLITADLIYNFQRENFAAEKIFFRLIGSYGRPSVTFYHRFAVEDKVSVQALMEAVNGWGVRRIIMSHGRIISACDAGEIFTAAWARFA